MGINFSNGTMDYPSYVYHTVYVQDNTRESFSNGTSSRSLDRYQLNNIKVATTTDIVHLDCRIYNQFDDHDDEFGYSWEYKNSSGNFVEITQNKTRGVDIYGRSGFAGHGTHDRLHSRYGGHTYSWGIIWKPGSISGVSPGAIDVRPFIKCHGNTGHTMRINHFDDGYSGNNSEWNRASSSWASAVVYSTNGVVDDTN